VVGASVKSWPALQGDRDGQTVGGRRFIIKPAKHRRKVGCQRQTVAMLELKNDRP